MVFFLISSYIHRPVLTCLFPYMCVTAQCNSMSRYWLIHIVLLFGEGHEGIFTYLHFYQAGHWLAYLLVKGFPFFFFFVSKCLIKGGRLAFYLRKLVWEGGFEEVATLWQSWWGQMWNEQWCYLQGAGWLWRKALHVQGFGLSWKKLQKGLTGEAGEAHCPLGSLAGIGIVPSSDFPSLGAGRFRSHCPMFSSGSWILR